MHLLLTLLMSTAWAQTFDHDVVRHSDIADVRPASMKPGFVGSYEAAAGYTVAVGDIVAVNVPTGASSSATAVGNKRITAVKREFFQHVYNGTHAGTVGKMVMAGLAGEVDPALYMAPATLSGAEMRVTRMKLAGPRKRSVVWMECELVNSRDKKNVTGILTIADYETAIRSGEVYNPNHITREIAIERLKEAKDLLDMGVYTQDQFEAEKEKYAKFL